MKKYGLRIGDIGVEFPSTEDRQKALIAFTKGTDVKISERGIKFSDGKGSFSVYDRDTKEIVTTCEVCHGTFLIDSCPSKDYPNKYSYADNWHQTSGHICDACYAKKVRDKEIYDAKKKLEEAEE